MYNYNGYVGAGGLTYSYPPAETKDQFIRRYVRELQTDTGDYSDIRKLIAEARLLWDESVNVNGK